MVSSEATSSETPRNSFDGQYISFKDIDDGRYLIKANSDTTTSSAAGQEDFPKYYGSLLQGQCSLKSLQRRSICVSQTQNRSNSVVLLSRDSNTENTGNSNTENSKLKSVGGHKGK